MSRAKRPATFQITDLHVSIADKQILNGLTLTVKPGEMHAIMGPNGSGKSTLAYTLAGHPEYQVAGGSQVSLNGQDLLAMSPDERAQAGLFLAFQYPIEIPGVKVRNFLRLAARARFGEAEVAKRWPTALAFFQCLDQLAGELAVPAELLQRGLNEGFSGGEKKRLEILQMAVLEPKYAILDETDSGLDIDAIKAVAAGVKMILEKNHTGVLVITHYQRILDYLKPDFVHVVKKGVIAQSGGPELIAHIETSGYQHV